MTFLEVMTQLAEGFTTSLMLFGFTLILSLPLGLIVSFGSMSKFKPLSTLTRTFVWVIRGTPLMLQIFVIFYLPGLMFGTPIQNRFLAALIAFVLNYAAYFSEIFRGGIENIERGQYEAGAVLGLSNLQTFQKIILPQVYKRILPSMSNEVITLVKDTSLAQVISVMEIFMVASSIASTYAILWPIFATGAFYLIFVGVLTLTFGKLEKKVSYYSV